MAAVGVVRHRFPTWRPSALQLISSVIFAWVGICLVVVAIVAMSGALPVLVIGSAVVIMLSFAGRAPFVGVQIDGAMLVRRGWCRTRRHPVKAISWVGVGLYTGWLASWNRWGPTPSAAVTIKLDDARVLELRELYGWASRMHTVANDINRALGLPVADLRPKHHAPPQQ